MRYATNAAQEVFIGKANEVKDLFNAQIDYFMGEHDKLK